MDTKFASIIITDKDGVFLETPNKPITRFSDIVECCRDILKINFNNSDFLPSKFTNMNGIKRIIDLCKDEISYWYEMPNFNNKAFKIQDVESLLVAVLRNQIYNSELSNKSNEEFVKCCCSSEEDLMNGLRKLLKMS